MNEGGEGMSTDAEWLIEWAEAQADALANSDPYSVSTSNARNFRALAAALAEATADLRKAREERDKALHQRDNFERIAQEQAERAHRLWLRVNDLEQADVALGEGAKG